MSSTRVESGSYFADVSISQDGKTNRRDVSIRASRRLIFVDYFIRYHSLRLIKIPLYVMLFVNKSLIKRKRKP